MSLLANIFGGGAAELFKTVMGQIRISPERKAELEAALEAHKFELAKIDAELESKLADAAGQNIRAEAQSGDKFTSRARPTFLYIVNFILLWNYVIAPLVHRQVLSFPEPLFWLFGSVMLGYVGARSWEKVSQIKNGI